MSVARPLNLVDQYVDWLRARFEQRSVDGIVEITTPFLDRHNDYLQIHVEPTAGGFVLTDDGYTLGDLAMSGCDISSERRARMLGVILGGMGVKRSGNSLITEATAENFPQRKHRLVQAMLAVNDMFLTARPHVTSLFLEDVGRFLREHGVRHNSRIQLMGRSGFTQTFDFMIPPSNTKPERILKVINHPTRDSVASFLFAWQDTRETREENATAYAVLNDEEKAVAPDIRGALAEYQAIPVPWSEAREYVGEWAA